jgi:hypothetical protein
MLGRALSLAAVTLLVGFLMVPSVCWAQVQNLEAGKSPSQLFAGTCNACHRSPRGLFKTVSPGSLPGFLREHYTTSGDMASQLSAFLISNGAGDARYQAKQGADAKQGSGSEDRQGRRSRQTGSQEAARPEAEPSSNPSGRNRRQGTLGEAPDSAKPSPDGQGPAQSATERGPDGRRLSTTRQRLSKRGKSGADEVPATRGEPSKLEPAVDDRVKSETVKEGDGKADDAKASGEGNSEAARVDTPKEGSGNETPTRPGSEPVAPVPVASSPPPRPPSGSSNEPAAAEPQAAAPLDKPATVTASEPPAPAPPVAAAGAPAPPISQ